MAVLRLPLPADSSTLSSSSAPLAPTMHNDSGSGDHTRRMVVPPQQQQQHLASSSQSSSSKQPIMDVNVLDDARMNATILFSTTPITSNLASSSSLSLGMTMTGFHARSSANNNNILSSSSSSSQWNNNNYRGGIIGSEGESVANGANSVDVVKKAQTQSTQWQYPWQRSQQFQQQFQQQQQQQQQHQWLPPKHPATTAISMLGGRGGTATVATSTSTTTAGMPLGRVVIGGGGGREQPPTKYVQSQRLQQQLLLHAPPPQQQQQQMMMMMKASTLGVVPVQASPINGYESGGLDELQLPDSSPQQDEEEKVEAEEEMPLTTGPVTLGIHEAQTFDGVELALHPDIFATTNSCSTIIQCDSKEQCPLRPGDLVEIRVWCVRPGMAAQASSVLQQSNNLVESVLLKSKQPGTTTATTTARTSLHSRNTSLTTIASSISNTSLTNTPKQQHRQQQSVNQIIVHAPPPLPAVVGVGGGSASLCGSVDGNSTESEKLFGENLLHGEIHFETPKATHAPTTITASNISSVLSDAASSLFRKIAAPLADAGGGNRQQQASATSDDASVFTHSRDSSMVSNSINDSDLFTAKEAITPAQRESKLMPPNSPPHLPLSPTSHTTSMIRTLTPPSVHSSPTKLMSTPISTPTPNPIRSKSVVAPVSTGFNTPAVRRSASASISLEKPKAVVENLPPTLFLAPDIGAPTNPLRDASAGIVSSSSNPLQKEIASHRAIMRPNVLANGVENTAIPSHRRYGSSIPTTTTSSLAFSSSFPAPNVPQSAVRSNIHKGNTVISSGNTTKQINDLLQSTHFVRISFIMPVSEGSLSSIKSGARTKVSLLRRVADLYGITAYDTVTVTQIGRSKVPIVQQSIAADFLTVTFKDQFVSRGDMYKFQKEFINCWVYEGKRLSFNGIQTITKVIRRGDHVVRAALITEDTKLTFRSRSARIIWLVQMSSEMWDFASPYDTVGNQTSHEPSCKIYFDKFVGFVRRLFNKWKKLELTHNLTVVFFSRTYIREQEFDNNEKSSSVQVDSDSRKFVDHYKIVLENEMSAGDNLILRIKQQFVNYPKEVGWDLTRGSERLPSTASQGNVLEAINITLNLLHLHYIDRDLHRTGNSIVVITPGNGVFEIEKNLAGITKQRMMDNGIGSDMLSLGLPPLHVAPFFLYKEKSASSAEEIQGFDDWKTYFEVPHWMNLSFVDYDNDEDPTLYKEHVNDGEILLDNKDKAEDDEKILRQWSASNGFLKRNKIGAFVPGAQADLDNSDSHQHKHLISDREFEDILQACRPRYRGDHEAGLPRPLATLLQKVTIGANLSTDLPQLHDHSRSQHLERGAVSSQQASSSFTNNGSHLFHRFSSQLNSSHLQQPRSFEAGEHLDLSGGATLVSIEKALEFGEGSRDVQRDHRSSSLHNLSDIRKMMADHDKQIFYNNPKELDKHEIKAQNLIGDRNNVIESYCPVSPILDRREIIRPHMLSKGGIEAALIQHDGTRLNRENKFSRTGAAPNRNGSPVCMGVSPPSQAVSPLRLATTPLSLDRRNEGLRHGIPRAPTGLPRASRVFEAADAFLPFEPQRKTFSQTHAQSRDDVYHYDKAFGHSITESRLLHRRKSQWDNVESKGSKRQPSEIVSIGDHQRISQTSSPQRVKLKTQINRKIHQHQSFHGQKLWVLNPFRQEDEEEVLAKRTHNRRRWSHVFPLGEDEFKRHAGPNWKSLCQPAILPMTIDFHPSPQDLDDQAKFSVKQYSVTLPPMNETTYKSHTELLDDLLMQRMRQDFQIVPRNIIQHSRRDTTENLLEATLSMGHKIQRLSYNPITDSVDVVQYYARFAEDETPQTYHYLLWSTLQQNYVNAFQTFTKYTRPYRWNELDMLIGGDAETTILEGMRHPRISFLIIPDQFADSLGENEYLIKFQRLTEYLGKLQQKDDTRSISIEICRSSVADPQASSGDKRFVVDLRKKRDDKYEWMEMVHDSNCDTRRTFRITIQWLVAVASKIDQHAKNLQRRCSQYGLKLVSVPHYSCLRSCFMNPFAVPIKHLVHDKECVDAIEKTLTRHFDFVYDGNHLSDPNDIECLDRFDFVANKWSIKEKKEFVTGRQYLHRTGTLFTRFLRDTRGSAIIITYLNQRHIAGDERLLRCARAVFHRLEQYISEVCNEAASIFLD